jgi:DNA-binding NarL/FixJ family response regulator
LQDLNSNHLGAIKGKRFTRRETDVIACLMCGRAATIPSLLSISSRTVEAHVRNIMLKLECNSREGIVNFVEQ